MAHPRQPGRRRPVDVKFDRRVTLQKTGGKRVGLRPLDRPGYGLGLGLAPGQHHDSACVQDRAHTHRDRVPRHIGFAQEVPGGIPAGHGVEGDQTGARLASGAGFVETDVPGAADAEDLQVNAARLSDCPLVALAPAKDLRALHRAIGDVHVSGRNVDVAEQLLVHEPPVAFGVRAGQPVVLVEVERDHVLEAQSLLPVPADQLAIKAHRSGPGRKAEHCGAAGPVIASNDGRNLRRHDGGGLVGIGVDHGADAFTLFVFGGRDAVGCRVHDGSGEAATAVWAA